MMARRHQNESDVIYGWAVHQQGVVLWRLFVFLVLFVLINDFAYFFHFEVRSWIYCVLKKVGLFSVRCVNF